MDKGQISYAKHRGQLVEPEMIDISDNFKNGDDYA